MDPNALLSALPVGDVEGLTEFLPVSSTGHLILPCEAIGFHGPPGEVFGISIQLGAILAVVCIHRAALRRIAARMRLPWTEERRYATNILLAFLTAMAPGPTLHGLITECLFGPLVVALALLAGGAATILMERSRPSPRVHSVAVVGPSAALLVGFGQALAMVPGTSRSAPTVIASPLFGVERRTAAEFGFILAVPTMLAATVHSLWKARADLDAAGAGSVASGFAAAFGATLLAVRWVLAVMGRMGFAPAGQYRIAPGTAAPAWLAPR